MDGRSYDPISSIAALVLTLTVLDRFQNLTLGARSSHRDSLNSMPRYFCDVTSELSYLDTRIGVRMQR